MKCNQGQNQTLIVKRQLCIFVTIMFCPIMHFSYLFLLIMQFPIMHFPIVHFPTMVKNSTLIFKEDILLFE